MKMRITMMIMETKMVSKTTRRKTKKSTLTTKLTSWMKISTSFTTKCVRETSPSEKSGSPANSSCPTKRHLVRP